MTERGGGEGQRGSTAQRTAGWAGAQGPQRTIRHWMGPAAGAKGVDFKQYQATVIHLLPWHLGLRKRRTAP